MSDTTTMHDVPADDAEFEGVLDTYRNAVYDHDYLTVIEEDEFNAIRRAVLDLHQRRVDQAKAEVLGELRGWIQGQMKRPDSFGLISPSDYDHNRALGIVIDQIDALLNQKGGE